MTIYISNDIVNLTHDDLPEPPNKKLRLSFDIPLGVTSFGIFFNSLNLTLLDSAEFYLEYTRLYSIIENPPCDELSINEGLKRFVSAIPVTMKNNDANGLLLVLMCLKGLFERNDAGLFCFVLLSS